MAYEQITFSKLSKERKTQVRTMVPTLLNQGLTTTQISKKLRVSPKSIATMLGNMNR